MTATELIAHLDKEYSTYSIDKPLPLIYNVDPITYANVCQYTFCRKSKETNQRIIQIAIGKHGGIMLKGVELILTGTEYGQA